MTTLVGRVRDQAELAGLLNNLYDLHLPILGVKNLEADNGRAEEQLDSHQ